MDSQTQNDRSHERCLFALAEAQSELITVQERAMRLRSVGVPEEMLQDAIVKARTKFEVARRNYLDLPV